MTTVEGDKLPVKKMIEVRTTIPEAEYSKLLQQLNTETEAAGVTIYFSADTIARTYAGIMWYDWFHEHRCWFEDLYGWSEDDSDGETMIGCVAADNVGGSVTIVWLFDGADQDERNLAMLFKLTFGGAA